VSTTDSKRFHIYKSSAGSGKTTSLIGKYLELSLISSNPFAFKSILAITFTNKAADELKERFISALRLLKSINPSNDKDLNKVEVQHLLGSLKIKPSELKSRAQKVFDIALRDYDEIGISTIDSFNHGLISSFSRDLRIKSDFEVELDEKQFFSETVDRLFERVGTDHHLTHHLLGYLQQSIEEDKKSNITGRLNALKHLVTKEDAIRPMESLLNIEPASFKKTKKTLFPIIQNFESRCRKIGDAAQSIFEEVGVTADDLKYKKNGYVGYFRKLSGFNGSYVTLHKNLLPEVEQTWLGKGASAAIVSAMSTKQDDLIQLYRSAEKLFENDYSEYITASKLLSEIDLIALLADLAFEMKELSKEKNVLLISEFNRIISKSMRDEPVAYIYEKYGNRYKHILIDEFQDTSELQWKNITPFISDSLASGQFNMVVGDAKQSIYRWRGGKAEQLIDLPELDHSDVHISESDRVTIRSNAQVIPLDTNYRSLPVIVNFNNQLIDRLKNFLTNPEGSFRAEYEGASAIQKVPDHKEGGFVQWTELDKNALPELVANQVKSAVMDAHQDGYTYGDMAILVRKKSDDVNAIIEGLTGANIPLTTKDSFGLDMNPVVELLISFLRLSIAPDLAPAQIKAMREICRLIEIPFEPTTYWIAQNKEGRIDFDKFLFEINCDFSLGELAGLSAIDICSVVIKNFIPEPSKGDVFIQSFLNYILEKGYSSSAAEILHWWDHLNNKPEAKVGDSDNQVKIMTIHKSKGLQFPVVIIPNLNWKFSNKTEKKWISIKDTHRIPFDYLPLSMGKSLEQMDYEKEYQSYQEELHFDNLNLIYVAITRPSQRLYLYHNNGWSNETGSVISKAYDEIVNEKGSKLNPTRYESSPESEGVVSSIQFGIKSEPSHSIEKSRITRLAPINMDITPLQERFKISNESISSHRLSGVLFHELAARTNTLNEAHNQLDKWRKNNSVSDKKLQELRTWIEALYADQMYQELMLNSVKLAERTLHIDGEVHRPDVVFKTNVGFTVIDFKTGQEDDRHLAQVQSYLDALAQIEGSQGTGYVIYLPEMKWTKVDVQGENGIQKTLF